MVRSFVSVPILIALSVFCFLCYTTVFVVIDQWLGLNTSPGLMNASIFTLLALMSVVTYGITIVKDPGEVPFTFAPDMEDSESPIHEIKRKGGDLRYCQKCSNYKPPRAHHCRVCKKCVLRMALLIGSVAYGVHQDEQNGCSFKTTYITFGVLLCSMTLALSILLCWHIYLILQNKTTIEYHEGVRAMLMAEKVRNIYSHPYDLGIYENLVSVLGPNIFSWICPTSKHIGSGLQFGTAYKNPFSSIPR